MREIKFMALDPETKLLGRGMDLEDLIYYNQDVSAYEVLGNIYERPELCGW